MNKIPASIPKKFHKYIEHINYSDGFCELLHKNGEAWDCFLVGLSNNGLHTIIEHKLSDVVAKLKEMKPCNCEECQYIKNNKM
jgi:hypothetical protein